MIRGLDSEVKRRLRVRAASHDRSMTAEARAIITDAVTDAGNPTDSLADAFRGMPDVSDIDLDALLPARRTEPVRELDFE